MTRSSERIRVPGHIITGALIVTIGSAVLTTCAARPIGEMNERVAFWKEYSDCLAGTSYDEDHAKVNVSGVLWPGDTTIALKPVKGLDTESLQTLAFKRDGDLFEPVNDQTWAIYNMQSCEVTTA
ncbi:MAG TPA: hypothetical protein VMR45_05155 [Patescibacteria group bacterium]|nr:hypothetical protein [Patescibacteria group bacterium]